MKLTLHVSVFLISMIGLLGCATNGTDVDAEASPDTYIEFIDLETFDLSMTRDLQRESDTVTVGFPNQAVSVNDLPERLQKWLSAVHKHGKGLTVETEDGYVEKDILSIVGILVSGYKIVKNNMPAILGRKYKAVITVADKEGSIDKVEFVRF